MFENKFDSLKTWGKKVSERFDASVRSASLPMVVGFGLCQLWISLCFFAPQLFPENSSVAVYEISLVISAIALLPCIFMPKKMEAILGNKTALYAMAICAGVGTFIIPFSSGMGAIPLMLQILAAALTGTSSGWLFVAWYQAFCRADDLPGFILSVLASSVFMYLITAISSVPAITPWIFVAVASGIPVVSVFFLVRSPRKDSFVIEYSLPKRHTLPWRVLIVFCISIFTVSLIDEFMRNFYLSGTDLEFYSSGLNLFLLLLKVACSVLMLSIISERDISRLYQASFLLTMIAVLFMPYSSLSMEFFYSITNFGAFLFKTIVIVVAFNYFRHFRTAPVIVFALTRLTFSLDLLCGFALYEVFCYGTAFNPDFLGISSVLMGLLIIAIYLFVFTKENTLPPLTVRSMPDAPASDTLTSQVARLARLGKLSKREKEVMTLIAKGRSTPRIMEELSLSKNTVNTHTSHIYQKLQVHSRQELLDLLEQSAPDDSEEGVAN